MAKINRAAFFKAYRKKFSSRLKKSQVKGYDLIFDYWESNKKRDLRKLAYCLATAYHETGAKMKPVREGFASTDKGARKAVKKLFKKGRISHDYAKPEENGKSYFGRGIVQLTHAYNYKKVGKALGLGNNLYEHPSVALEPYWSVKILIEGMETGLFTGKKLKKYFNKTSTDWRNARKTVNGTDKAELIATYAKRFYQCLSINPTPRKVKKDKKTDSPKNTRKQTRKKRPLSKPRKKNETLADRIKFLKKKRGLIK